MTTRLAGTLLLLVLTVSFTGLAYAAYTAHSASQTCEYYFIIYGQEWCPHCQNMEAFVRDNYGSQCLEFRDLDVPAWGENFTLIIQDLNQKYQVPVQAAFPLTGIVVDGKLRVIVQGEVTNRDAIDYMVQKADSEGQEWVAVFIGAQAYAIKPDATILKAFIPEQSTTESNGGGVNTTLIVAGGILIIVALIGVAYLARKK
ncbi:MAG: hypothetical protein F7C37_01710 [Desulfurococcales archaeon]|nr:hypothetical protein [Desulfurococcales archaeon]